MTPKRPEIREGGSEPLLGHRIEQGNLGKFFSSAQSRERHRAAGIVAQAAITAPGAGSGLHSDCFRRGTRRALCERLTSRRRDRARDGYASGVDAATLLLTKLIGAKVIGTSK
jgi:hypothetical protein